MIATKQDLKAIENKIDLILNQETYISEDQLCVLMNRSKAWLKHARNGTKKKPAIFKKTDWYSINGRSIMYKKSSVDRIIKQLS